ncbi:MAG: hypothetical protein ACYCPQ_08715 [Elusimicrobiota bacterium]
MSFIFACILSLALLPRAAKAQEAPPAGQSLSLANVGENDVITPAIQGVPKVFLPDFGIAGDFAYQRSSLPKSDPRYTQSLQQPGIRDGQLVAFSPIDPYTNAQFTIDLPQGGVANIEEAWLYFHKLPMGIDVRVGRFLPQFGLLDQTNTFQLAMLNRPSAIADFIGSDGMDATGAEANFYIPNPWDLNLKADLNAVEGDVLGGPMNNGSLAYLGTLDYSSDFLVNGSIESGVSAAQGPSPYGLSETLVNPYLQIQYAPSQRRVWTWSVEGMLAERQGMGNQNFKRSAYTFLDYNFALRYHVGFLIDVADLPGSLPDTVYPGAFPDAFAGAPYGTQVNLAPNFTWFLSDNTRLRLQYTHTTPTASERANETTSLQVTFSLGNLKQLD